MTHIASRPASPAPIPLITLLMLGLAASTLLALKHEAPIPSAGYTAADYAVVSSSTTRAAPYGSGAVIRNLLF